ncbi:MAG: AAA domain protein [Candidatus Argoarchaeum ethanivorans]|uniref:AAA domain protein n=1 Tax=Candidatus Argoarchaeum ethanivorans TaxID=2608793 RepID=A0A811T7K3_9EURY|nr:MAG: AAA domain protein [Candidatus Argoarchaeum ethanivorans]
MTIPREIEPILKSDLINDIIGPRRAGKTYLMFLTIKKLLSSGVDKRATIYLNFEDRRLLPSTPEYFGDLVEFIHAKRLLDHGRIFVFLDEIRRIEGWESYIRSIYDEFKGKVKIFVSGSTSKLTESELSHLLTGRHLTTRVFPLSFGEFLRFKDVDYGGDYLTEKDTATIKEMLREYISFGGFPEVVLLESNKEYLAQTLFTDIISRDVVSSIKKKREVIEDLSYFLASNVGKPTSFSKMCKMMNSVGVKISVPTLERYFFIMKDAFLFFDIRIFSYKVKDQLQYPRKIYAMDPGFANLSGFRFSGEIGRSMENLVAVELLRMKSSSPLLEIYYWKDYQHREVDFVLKSGLRIEQLIQVTYAGNREDIAARGTRALVKAGEELRCDDLLVITWDYESDSGAIRFLPLWKWLLYHGTME